MAARLLTEMVCWLVLDSVHCYDNSLMMIMMINNMHSHSSQTTSNLCKVHTTNIHA